MQLLFESPRLYFRNITVADAPMFYELNADNDVIRYTGDTAFENIEAAKTFILNYKDYELHGIGRWAMVLKSTHEILGWCGLKYLPELAEVDLGYRLFKKHWNQGFATEGSLACLKYGFEEKNYAEIVGRAWKINGSSIRVLEKCGLIFWKDAIFDGQSGSYFKMTKDEYFKI